VRNGLSFTNKDEWRSVKWVVYSCVFTRNCKYRWRPANIVGQWFRIQTEFI